MTRFISQFPKLNCLQHLYVNSLLSETPLENIAQGPEEPLGDPLYDSLPPFSIRPLSSFPLDLLNLDNVVISNLLVFDCSVVPW